MFDPSEPTNDELLAVQNLPLEELRSKVKYYIEAIEDPFADTSNVIMAAHAEKLYQYELQRRREAL